MIQVGKNAKLNFHWKVNPYDFSKEKENSLIAKISKKYGVERSRVKVIPEFIMVNSNGEKISVATDIISNIQNPQFQLKLFQEYLLVNGIKDYDFELIKKIDAELNGKLNYEVYDKYRQYSIKWVKWKNFLSYGDDNFFDFTKLSGIVLLNGEPANQSGKTTFAIDLLHFLLYGKTDKAATQEKIFNKHMPEATEVVVEGCINIEGIDYVIKRTLKRPSLSKRSSRSKTVQKVDYYKIVEGNAEELVDYVDNQQEENSIQTNKVIKDAIGNESDFDMIICATSSNLDDLIEKKETDRGKMLSRWIGLLPIEEKDILAREKFNSEVKPYLISTKYNSESLQQEIAILEEKISTLIKEIDKYKKEIPKLDGEIAKQEQLKENLLQAKTMVDESLLKLDINTLKAKMDGLISEGSKKGEQVKVIDDELKEIGDVTFSVDEYDSLVNELNRINSELTLVKERYRSTNELINTIKKSEVCPTCGRRYDNVNNEEQLNSLNKKLDEYVEEGKKLRVEYDSVNAKILQMKDNREKYDRQSKLNISKSALQLNIERLRNEYKDCKSILVEYQKNTEAIDKNNTIDINIRNTQSIIDNYRNTRETNIRLIENFGNDVKSLSEQIAERNTIIEQIKNETILLRNWRIYLDMIGKNGVSKMVLRKALPIINAQIAFLLSDVCDFTVEITINDKNDIMFYLVKDGVYSDLTSGSGFERTASALALRVVLGNISTLPKVNCLILDEIYGRVAEENLDSMRSLLNKISDKYQYIMQISHLHSIKDWSNEVITVSKTANISKVCVSAR